MKKHIPNAITLLNLFCGCLAVVLAVNNNFVAAGLFVFAGIFFDFFDGMFARMLGVQSALGIQLDSLADLVTSGLVPGIVMFKLLTLASDQTAIASLSGDWDDIVHWHNFKFAPVALLGFLITLASAYRLAKFNVDEDQQTYFKGLPTPANALLILSLPMIIEFQQNNIMNTTIVNVFFLLGVTLVSSYLLISPIKLFALKFKDWSFKASGIKYIFIALSIVLLVVLKFASIPIIILSYIVLSLVFNPYKKTF